jgi:hypothetical protein
MSNILLIYYIFIHKYIYIKDNDFISIFPTLIYYKKQNHILYIKQLNTINNHHILIFHQLLISIHII